MDYQLDRKIIVNYAPQYNSLYKWCLNEYDSKNEKINKDWVPYAFNLYFICSSLKLIRQTYLTTDRDSGDTKKATQKITITGNIHSGFCRDGETLTDDVGYSFFGTNRKIEKFNFSISEADEGQEEHCRLYGIPSYTSEIDFVDSTEPDYLGFDVYLKKERFTTLVQQLEQKAVDSCWISAGFVKGFYSEWSPSVSTHFIKVLTPSHEIEGIDENKFTPTCVGDVREFSIHFTSLHKLNVKQGLTEKFNFEEEFEPLPLEFSDSDSEEELARQREMKSQQMYAESIAIASKLAASLKFPLWLIFIALVLLLLK